MTPTELTASGVYTAPASATTGKVYKITAGYPAGKFLLIENRQPVKFDLKITAGIGGTGGLAIWHIDEKRGSLHDNTVNADPGFPGQSGFPTYGKHYGIALLQADGNFDLENNANRGTGTTYSGPGSRPRSIHDEPDHEWPSERQRRDAGERDHRNLGERPDDDVPLIQRCAASSGDRLGEEGDPRPDLSTGAEAGGDERPDRGAKGEGRIDTRRRAADAVAGGRREEQVSRCESPGGREHQRIVWSRRRSSRMP